MSAILHSEPVSLSEAGIPHDLQKIVTRCLRKDAARRFQHTDDLKIALQEVVEQFDSGSSPSRAPPRKSRIVPLAIGTVAILVAGAALWVGRFRMTPREAPLNAIPLTTYPGRERYPTFSPDGSQIAFTWDGGEQNTDIYVKAIGAGAPLRLTVNPARDFAPAWSPDGRFIAFARQIGPDRTAILQIPALGGAESKLGQALWTSDDILAFVLSWSPDGKHLVIPDRKTPQEPTKLFAFVLGTGDKRSLTDPPLRSIGDSGPAVSPDGRSVAFIRSSSYAVSDLWVLSLAEDFTPKGEPRQLTSDQRQVSGCAWTPDGSEIVFASNRTGSRALWRSAASGTETPVRLASVGEGAWSPAIARAGAGQGTRLAYDSTGPAFDIHRLDIQKGIETQFISSTRHDANAQYSPDGSRIAFVSDQSGAFEVWVCQGDGSNRQPLTSFRGPITDLPSWSPDGLRIAFHSRPESTADIYVIDADGGAPRRLTTEPSDDIAPTWSRDGRRIYFGSNRSGNHQIWRLPASGGVAVQVTRNGGIFAQESHDGRFLFYTKIRGVAGLWKTPLTEGTAMGPESQVAEAVYYLNFAVRPEGVYFGSGGPIQFLPFTGGPLVSFGAKTGRALLSVSPDRKFFLYSVSRSTSDLMLVENFR